MDLVFEGFIVTNDLSDHSEILAKSLLRFSADSTGSSTTSNRVVHQHKQKALIHDYL
jgi:hypothetical protein